MKYLKMINYIIFVLIFVLLNYYIYVATVGSYMKAGLLLLVVIVYLLHSITQNQIKILDNKNEKYRIPKGWFLKISTKTMPDVDGWYDTDKGNLYFFVELECWSCREDRLSEEYPKWWLKD